MQLDPAADAEGVRLIACRELPSTSSHAFDLARRGERGPLWVTAERQTHGRGRRGNRWISAPGNLYASLLLTDPAPARDAAGLSFVAALAVRDAVTELCPALGQRVALKWPNDVLLGGAKVAGILVEAESSGTDALSVVIGIGVNCADHPEGTEFPPTSLAASGANVGAADVFRVLSAAMQRRLAQWDRGSHFAAVRADWISAAAGLGGPMRVRLPDRALAGTFEALDNAGRLVLRLPDGRAATIAAGEVFGFGEGAAHAGEMSAHG